MAVNLYEHQKRAVSRMKNGCILCGGVGSGKSRTALAYYVKYVCGGYYDRHGGKRGVDISNSVPLYIITTARKRDTCEWEKELAHFLLAPSPAQSLAPVVIDSWNNISKYKDVSSSFFIFDEQRIVGTGKWAMTFTKIAKRNRWVLLSATPGDTWMDYWAVFVANGFYKNVTDFRQQHVVYQRFGKFPKIVRYIGTRKLERLRNEILISMDFEKEATRHHAYIKVGYSEDVYKTVAKERWNVVENRPIESVSECCYLLRKIVNSDPRRVVAVLNVLSRHRRAIIFYNFDYELAMLRSMCEDNAIPYSEWNGHKHQPILSEPQWVYLVQYISGAEGWNCTETDTIIFFSQTYSYKTLEQACGRIDRLNTPFTDLFYYHILSDADIDHAIRRCLKTKKNFNEKAYFSSI